MADSTDQANDDKPRRRGPGRPRKGAGWVAENKPHGFYCPDELWDRVVREAETSGRSQTNVICDALRLYFDL